MPKNAKPGVIYLALDGNLTNIDEWLPLYTLGWKFVATPITHEELNSAGVDSLMLSEIDSNLLDHLSTMGRDSHHKFKPLPEIGERLIDVVVVNIPDLDEDMSDEEQGAVAFIVKIIRTAAMNHDVSVLINPEGYAGVMKEILSSGVISKLTRQSLAEDAYKYLFYLESLALGWLDLPSSDAVPSFLSRTFPQS